MTDEGQVSKEWVERARELFRAPRPEHFTNYRHCCECAEHDETLLQADIDTIGLAELGNPGWDPICFATPEGKKYYVPAMVRLSLDTLADEFYLAQFLFHLEYDGPGNGFFAACSEPQRAFIADFIAHLIEHYPAEIDAGFCSDEALRVHQIWTGG
jgi:hypothetical protein